MPKLGLGLMDIIFAVYMFEQHKQAASLHFCFARPVSDFNLETNIII